jgi:hypothetical protein
MAVFGNTIWLVGGRGTSGELGSVTSTTVGPSGALSTSTPPNVALRTPRTGLAHVVGNFLYVIAGEGGGFQPLASIERANINASGGLGAFVVSPNGEVSTHTYGTALAIGSNAWIVGGNTATVEKASVAPDGSLGPFVLTAVKSPATGGQGRTRFATAVLGDKVYAIGGTIGPDSVTSVAQASIDATGALSNFTDYPGSSLGTGRTLPNAFVVGSQLYVIGGTDIRSNAVFDSIEVAPVAADGSLGAFAPVSQKLELTRYDFKSLLLGTNVRALAGYSPNQGGTLAQIGVAPVDATGLTGT